MRAVVLLFLVLAVCSALAACSTSSGERSRSHVADRTGTLFAADPVLVARTYIAADYDDVWRAFTTAEGYSPWYSTPPGGSVPKRALICDTLSAVAREMSWTCASIVSHQNFELPTLREQARIAIADCWN